METKGSTLLEPPLKTDKVFKMILHSFLLQKEVAIIKVGAHEKINNMGAKGNNL